MKHSPSRNLKSHTPARKSPYCYWDSWIGEGKPWEISGCQKRPRDWVQNPAIQYTPWNSTLNSIETAQGQGTQTRSTPEIRQLYPDLDAPKLCWILRGDWIPKNGCFFGKLPKGAYRICCPLCWYRGYKKCERVPETAIWTANPFCWSTHLLMWVVLCHRTICCFCPF